MMLLKTILCALSLLPAQADDSSEILYIGDSHSQGVYGQMLFTALKKQHPSLVNYSVCGSRPESWLWKADPKNPDQKEPDHYAGVGCCEGLSRGSSAEPMVVPAKDAPENRCRNKKAAVFIPKLSYLIDKHKPKAFIIQLGSNLIDHTMGELKESVGKILTMVKATGAPCVWIAAPDASPKNSKATTPDTLSLTEVNAALENEVSSQCLFFKTAEEFKKSCQKKGPQPKDCLTYPETGGDGLHFNPKTPDGQAYLAAWSLKSKELVDRMLTPIPPANAKQTPGSIKRF